MQLNDPSENGIRERINEVLSDPETRVKVRKRDGSRMYVAPDQTVLIHNTTQGTGTIYRSDDTQKDWDNFK